MNIENNANNSILNTYILKLNNREKQFYGALCLAKYCTVRKIVHPAIGKLISHLFSIMIARKLPEWENAGACLPINGRGDPLPQEICQALAPPELQDFRELVDMTVEIGLVDMYSSSTNLPERFLLGCLNMLEEKLIPPPEMIAFPKDIDSPIPWGGAINEEEYNSLLGKVKNVHPSTVDF